MKQFPTHIVAVDGIIENDRGEILLVRNSHSQMYTVPGGQVEAGENLMEALTREISEETGAMVEVGELLCVSSNTGSYEGYNGYDLVPTKLMLGFACRYVGGELHTSPENHETLWVPKEKVPDFLTSPWMLERFRAYLEREKGVTYLAYKTKPRYDLELRRFI